ncbi:Rhamnogalacturonan endolyase, partial [Penicillium ucsense]
MFVLGFLVASLAILGKGVEAAFGVTTTSNAYIIDTGSANPLRYTINRSNCDITSINYYGAELQYQSTGSHIGSGLGQATVTATQNGNYIKVTCETSTLTHYYVARNGDSIIYMATYTSTEPSIGELRYIARLNANLLPNEEPFGAVSNIAGGTAIEGSDVFKVGSQTRSKFYSSERFIDDHRHCVSGSQHRVCMILNQYETSSGGPFHRDINTNNVGDYTGLYWYMNSGHVQTEPFRTGLHGPYLMYFSRSGTPSTNIDTSFFADLGIKGYTAASGRGKITGKASGADSSMQWVIHWYNDNAQYWTYAASGGTFTSPAMKPGTYTMVYYQGEYLVAKTSVSVSAGATVNKDISGSVKTGNTIFRIGQWDGRPTGFLNSESQLRMHPTDQRMSSWTPQPFTIGSSPTSSFPMALFKSVNSPLTIRFTASSSQTGAATLRIGTTLSFAGGRPQVTVNGWTGPIPSAPTNLKSRGVTRGAYRGLGEIYDVNVPGGVIKEGGNEVIKIEETGHGDILSSSF